MVEIGWYEVLDRQVSDSPIKTQVELRIRVNRDATGARLESVLQSAYDAVASETGFTHHRNPNSIWIFAYTHDGWEADPTGWVGRVAQAAVDSGPSIMLAKGRGDMDANPFSDRVREACPMKKEQCIASADAKSVEIVQTVEEIEDGFADAKWTLWFNVFFAVEAMFEGVPDLETYVYRMEQEGTNVVLVAVTRAEYEAMDAKAVMAQVGEEEAKLDEANFAGKITEDVYERRRMKLFMDGWGGMLKKVGEKEIDPKWEP